MQTKYQLKQTVWFMLNNLPSFYRVKRIRITKFIHEEYAPRPLFGNTDDYPDPIETEKADVEYEVFNGTWVFMKESELFPTKEELVASLLK